MLVKVGYGHVINTDYLMEIRRDARVNDKYRWRVVLDPRLQQPAPITWDEVVILLRSLHWDEAEISAIISDTE